MSVRVFRVRRAVTWSLVIIGVLLVIAAAVAEVVGLGSTPGFGVLQTLFFLLGMTCLTVAVYLRMRARRPSDAPPSLQADIGIRLSATGLVLCYVSGFADLIRIGTHIAPNFDRPVMGPLQVGGLLLGLMLVAGGIVIYYTSRGRWPSSSLEFILNGNGDKDS